MTGLKDGGTTEIWDRYCQDQTRRCLERLEYRLSRVSIVNIVVYRIIRTLERPSWEWMYRLSVKVSNWRFARYGLFRRRRPRG